MNLKIGDRVLVLDENLSGKVIKIDGQNISIETEEGFVLDFIKSELILNQNESRLQGEMMSYNSIKDAITDKESKKRKIITKKSKERYEPTLEVDLHIHQLTDNFKGMSNHDMLTLQIETAKSQLEFAIRKRIQKVVFIHGVGEGVLKLEMDYLFGRYNNLKFYDANYKKYGLGATEVYIFQSVKPNP